MRRMSILGAAAAAVLAIAAPAMGTQPVEDGAIAVEWFFSVSPEIQILTEDSDEPAFVDFGTGPQWSHDGRYLAYTDSLGRIATVEHPYEASTVVHGPTVGTEPTFRWATDSHTLLISAEDGRRLIAVSAAGEVEHNYGLSGPGKWSPTGDYIVYASLEPELPCFECHATLLDPRDGGTLALGKWEAVWSPDGSSLITLGAEFSDGEGDLIIGQMEMAILQHTELYRIEGEAPWTQRPSLSPDGQWLATLDIDGTIELRGLESDAVHTAHVPDAVYSSEIQWSPTSEAFLLSRETNSGDVTRVVGLDLATLADLNGGNAKWSPTGAMIIYGTPSGMTVTPMSDLGAGVEYEIPVIDWAWQPFALVDIADSIFAADIRAAWDSGVTKGCNPPLNNAFCPDDPVTRGQMAAFLVRALDLTGDAASPFSDVAGTTFEADIARLANHGITKGCNPPDNDLFCPDGIVTRGQMAAFVVRALDLPAPPDSASFADMNGHTFRDDVSRLAYAGITKGCTQEGDDTRFCPNDPVTRGQMAAFLNRAGLLD